MGEDFVSFRYGIGIGRYEAGSSALEFRGFLSRLCNDTEWNVLRT